MLSSQSLLKSHLHFLDIPWTWEAQTGFLLQDQLVILIKPSAKNKFVLIFLCLQPLTGLKFPKETDFEMGRCRIFGAQDELRVLRQESGF